jgi:hypothetical protein
MGRRDVGSRAACGIPIICPLVQNFINILLKGTGLSHLRNFEMNRKVTKAVLKERPHFAFMGVYV